MPDFKSRSRRDDQRGRRNDGQRGNSRRDARAAEAEKHTAAMQARFGKEIERSLAGVKLFDGMPKLAKAAGSTSVKVGASLKADEAVEESAAAPAEVMDVETTDGAIDATVADNGADTASAEVSAVEGGSDAVEANDEPEEAPELQVDLPEVVVLDATATQAVLDNGRGYAQFCDLALLDFASFVNPGGGYIRGAFAQEEAICADSFLYNVLKEKRDWYQENRRRNINCELYRNRGLVVPAVRFERSKMHAYADVIVVAAPNARRAREEYNVTDAQLSGALRDRIRFVLAICDELGREKLVAGAFGCGAFGGDAEQVAEIFREELASGAWSVKQVIFAVPSSKWDENLPKFHHVLGTFPEANAESYADAAARAAEARAAEEAAAAAEEDDDDDDWRKYL